MIIILWMQLIFVCALEMAQSILKTMRYAPGHKAEVHRRIVRDSSRRVRAEGLAGAGVASVMRDTGLTHGGFYKHFESKDELLLASIKEAFRDFSGRLVAAAQQSGSEEPWKFIVKSYLSLENLRRVEESCPLATLAPDMARTDKKMRGEIVAELIKYKDLMTPFMPGGRKAEKERNFFVIFSAMTGALQLARIIPDPGAQEKILASTREFLLSNFEG
jgi:TetR/AcrR family transcriptional regulator, transcriptional repressor for nem operon